MIDKDKDESVDQAYLRFLKEFPLFDNDTRIRSVFVWAWYEGGDEAYQRVQRVLKKVSAMRI